MTDYNAVQTTVFQSGNSQAVRLPKAFRFNSKTVEIFRRGDEVVLREKKRSFAQALDEVLAGLAPMRDNDVRQLEAAMKLARERRPAEERDWSVLWDAPAEPARKSKSKPTPKSTAKAAGSPHR